MKYALLAILLIAGIVFFVRDTSTKGSDICTLENTHILTIGDSLANGFGVSEHDSFALKIPQALQKQAIKLGVDGETTRELLGRINAELSRQKSLAAVIISIGGNDFLRQYDDNQTRQNLENIVRIAKRHTGCVVVLGVPSGVMSSIAGNVAPLYKEVARAQNVLLDDNSMPRIIRNNDLKVDQIHPNKEGHQIITDNISRLILGGK